MSTPNLRSSVLVALTAAAIAVVILRPSPGKTDAPAGRYTIPGDGTVYDTATTLTWQRDASMTGIIWANAGPYCAGLTSPAGGGWRLPTINELATLFDYTRPGSPFIDPVAFPGVPAQSSTTVRDSFWSSTKLVGTSVGLTEGAWLAYFSSAITQPNPLNVGGAVRCVRGGTGGSGGSGGTGGASVGGAPGSGTGGAAGSPPIETGTFQSLPLKVNDLIFDSTRGAIYASMSRTATAGNSVLTIDPASGTVTRELPVGGLPTVLAISDDRSALYVGVDLPAGPGTPTLPLQGADSVRRIDLGSMTAGPPVLVGSGYSAGQLAAVPGSSTQYMVSRRQLGITPEFAGLALFDGNAMLAQLDSFFGEGSSLAFIDRSTLIGCSNDHDPSELIRYSVTSTAITPGTYVHGIVSGGQRTRIALGGGWVFASDGHALNATTLQPLGRYADPLTFSLSSVAPIPDPDGTKVWFLSLADGTNLALLAFDRTTFQLRRKILLGPLPDFLSNASALVRWSKTGFAFRTDEKLYLVKLPN
ncbi:MAG: DUF1566 domain-containing protein [Myxococcales bacterium]